MNPFDYFHDPFLMRLNSEEKQAIVEKLRVWGQMTQQFCERLDNWFCNFDDVDDKRLAVKILHNLKFYTPDDFTNRLKQLYGSIERHLSETNNNPSDIVLVIPDGHGDSADRHAYDLIKHWHLLRGQIYTVSELAQKTFTDPAFILFNDTHGTGNQFLKDIWPSLRQYGEHKIFVLAIAIAEEALNNFRKEMPRVHVIPAIPVMNAKTIFTGGEYLRLQEIGQRVYHKHPMGYGDAGILTAYYFQCPNNTLPIVWADGNNNEVLGKAYRWNPLFPYIPKKKTETTKPPSHPPSMSKNVKLRTPDNTTKVGPQSPNSVLTYRYRVAILDLDLGLTNLMALASALNRCQSCFHFTCPSSSNREIAAKAVISITGQKNLSVYQISQEFFNEFDELAVDVVGCFTKFPLAFVNKDNGSVSYNYFSGPSDVDGRFMFISANELQQFTKAAERSLEEGLAYILLTQLVVHFTNIGYHRNTAKCPMDFCEIRSNMIDGLRKREFCKMCTDRIKDDELRSAFEGILHWSPMGKQMEQGG
ncbi:MAG: hypothetical protein HGA87_03585 [Desulfobulbaceae bacterium]|nr:hypothetical protein [Desulfobulbaceae bacterium]